LIAYRALFIEYRALLQEYIGLPHKVASGLDMGWLRLVGSFKIYVFFAKKPYKTDLYSAKKTYNFKDPTNHSHPISI